MAKNPCDLNQNGERNKKEEGSLEIGVVGEVWTNKDSYTAERSAAGTLRARADISAHILVK